MRNYHGALAEAQHKGIKAAAARIAATGDTWQHGGQPRSLAAKLERRGSAQAALFFNAAMRMDPALFRAASDRDAAEGGEGAGSLSLSLSP